MFRSLGPVEDVLGIQESFTEWTLGVLDVPAALPRSAGGQMGGEFS